MSLNVLIDMNLSPDWVQVLQSAGWSAMHWSSVGSPTATDQQIMSWAVANNCVVFTHDLDFGTMLALTHSTGPSVLQVRTWDVLPDKLSQLVLLALKNHESDLTSGALVVVERGKNRVRVLPI